MNKVATLATLCSILTASMAFAPPKQHTFNFVQPHTTSITSTSLNAKKGFGKSTPKNTKPKVEDPVEAETPSSTASTTTEYATSNTDMGSDALARLRRQKAEQRNEELRQIRDLQNVDKMLQQDSNAAVIPERVAQRMGKRMLPFVGVPLFGLMGTFVTFWYLATYKNYEFQPALVAFSTIGVLAVGLLGITYSVMSASWDEDVEGSALGVDEFKKNFGSIQDGLKRTRENAILREKMSSVPEEEIGMAIRNLDRKEAVEKKKAMDLKQKMEKELE